MATIKTDRSRIEAGTCPAKRWWEYEYPTGAPTNGLRTTKPNVALSVGTGVHAGLEHLLKIVQVFGITAADAQLLEDAVDAAIAAYASAIGPYIPIPTVTSTLDEIEFNLFPEKKDDFDAATPYEIAEGAAHVEALVRSFFYSRNGLRWLEERYEIVEVEQEHEWSLYGAASTAAIEYEEGIDNVYSNIVMMSRLDSVVRSKTDGQLYVLEFKTAKSLDKRTLRQISFDDQGIAQILAAEDRHKEPVAGELRMYLLKDEKRTDSDGRYRFASPLIRPYVMQGMTVADSDIQPLYDKPGGGRLGKAYRRQNIWEAGQIGISAWIDRLNDRWPEVLDARIVPLEPIARTAEDRESWVISTIADETDRQFKAEILRNEILAGDMDAFQLNRQLQQMFPKRRKLCTYPSPCPFIGLCHEGLGLMLLSGNTPEEVGFLPRIPNHPGENKE